jgi:hypothetical protein
MMLLLKYLVWRTCHKASLDFFNFINVIDTDTEEGLEFRFTRKSQR